MSGRLASFWLKALEFSLAALALLVPLAFLLKSYDPHALKTTLLEAGALLLGGFWLLKGLARGRWEIPAQAAPMLLPALLLAGWIAARWAGAPSPGAALPAALRPLLGVLLFAVTLLEGGGARPAARFVSWACAAGWAAGLYAFSLRLGVEPKMVSPFGSASALGLLASACAPLVLVRLSDPERDRLMKGADLLLLLLLGNAAALSSDGLAAFAAAGTVASVALPLFLPSRSSLRAALWSAGLTAAVVLSAVAFDHASLGMDQQRQSALRRGLWTAALPAAKEHPLVGRGAGTMPLILDENRPASLLEEVGHDARPEHIPGSVLEFFCELGLIGALLWAWLFSAVAAAAWQAARRFVQRAALTEAAQLSGLFASLVTLLLVSQWSLAAHEAAPGWLLWPLAGFCGGLSLLAGRGAISVLPLPLGERGRRALSGAAAAAVMALLVVPTRWQAADVVLNHAVAAAQRGEFGEAARLAQSADVLGAPHALEAAYVSGQALLAAGRPQEALSALARLEERAPAYGQLHFVQARAAAAVGDWKQALAYAEEQNRLDSSFVPNLELLAAAGKQTGDYETAKRAALAAIALQPENPLPRVTLSQVYALERKAARDEDAQHRAKKKTTARPKAG